MIWMLVASLAHAGAVAEGAAAYDEGRLDEAIEAWGGVADEGGRASGVLSYNLGTAWLRKGDAPRAIAHLRAAARLRPRDGAVHHNLALARSELGVVPPAAPLPAGWMAVVTPGELGLLGLLLTVLGSAWLVHEWWQRGGRPSELLRAGSGDRQVRPVSPVRAAALALLVGGLLVGGTSAVGAQRLAAHPIAVVVDSEAPVRDDASVNAGVPFRLPLGAEVRVDRTYHGFLLVEDGRGRRGWLAAGAAEVGW